MMMLGDDEPVSFVQWQAHWNHFEDHDFARFR